MTNHTKIQEDRRSNSLQRKVLKYLAMYGPKTLTRLYAGFDELPTAEIAPVLDELRQVGYVEIGAATDTVLLTASGRAWLKDGK